MSLQTLKNLNEATVRHYITGRLLGNRTISALRLAAGRLQIVVEYSRLPLTACEDVVNALLPSPAMPAV